MGHRAGARYNLSASAVCSLQDAPQALHNDAERAVAALCAVYIRRLHGPRRAMDDGPPERYLCPISRDVMGDPVMVEHAGHVYWFDSKCLTAHAKTRYADSNPLTNVAGFRKAPRQKDEALRAEINASKWAPPEGEAEEVCFVDDAPVPEAPATISEIIDAVLPPHELDASPALYRLVVGVDLLPRSFLTAVRHSVASLDSYVLDILDDYGGDAQI